jgi:hypothetical protein
MAPPVLRLLDGVRSRMFYIVVIVVTTASKILNLSAIYILGPSPTSLKTISMKKHQVRELFIVFRLINVVLSSGYLSIARINVLSKIKVIINILNG